MDEITTWLTRKLDQRYQEREHLIEEVARLQLKAAQALERQCRVELEIVDIKAKLASRHGITRFPGAAA